MEQRLGVGFAKLLAQPKEVTLPDGSVFLLRPFSLADHAEMDRLEPNPLPKWQWDSLRLYVALRRAPGFECASWPAWQGAVDGEAFQRLRDAVLPAVEDVNASFRPRGTDAGKGSVGPLGTPALGN